MRNRLFNHGKLRDVLNVRDKIPVIFLSVIVALAAGFLMVFAFKDPAAGPDDTMYSLEQIYCKITGCSPTSYGLDSPGTPASTMYTIEQLYTATPAFRTNPGDAVSSDVCNSKDFYIDSSAVQHGVTGSGTYCCARMANGNACTEADQCTSGYCVDGYCCDTTCTGLCQACSAAKMHQGSNGTCGYVANGNDDDNECAVSTCSDIFNQMSGSCHNLCIATNRTTGVCNGSGACATTACACTSIGTDAGGTNGMIATSIPIVGCTLSGSGANCNTSLGYTGMCYGYFANFTNCNCD